MARGAVGLDIGTSAVRAAEVTGRKDPAVLTRFAQLALPQGAVVDGEIADADAVTSKIRELWRRGGFKLKRVAIGVANQKVVVRQVDLPFMAEEDLHGALQFQAQEYIPIPIEDAILDFQILEEFAGDDGQRMMRVLLVAAQRDMINTFVAAVQQAGLEPVLIDLTPFAALRPLIDPVPSLLGEREGEAVIDVGGGVTTVVVHEAGAPRFVRTLPVGGSEITDALVAALGIPPEDAEGVKARVGLAPEGAAAPSEGAAKVIEERATAFIDEIRGSIDYYQAQPGAVRVARAIVTGGGARLPNLLARLAAVLHIPVEEAQPLARVKLGKLGLAPEQLVQMSAVASVAVGLALGDV
ncbi:MAG: type IV pilus assembly protein PilM [Actinomycetota bacterium]